MQQNSTGRRVGSTLRVVGARALMTAVLMTAATSANAQTIVTINPLPGDDEALVLDISANGTAVVANSNSASGTRTFRWSASRGYEETGALPNTDWAWASAISGNGQVVLRTDANWDPWFTRATRWSRSGGLEDIGTFPNTPYGVMASAISFTGNTVVGGYYLDDNNYHPFRWTPAGLQDIGTLPGGNFGAAYAVSANGDVIYGGSNSADDIYEVPFRWTASTGARALPVVSPGDYANITDASQDGAVAVGYSGSSMALWRDGVARDLGTLPGSDAAIAYTVSGDGRVVGGSCLTYEPWTVSACVWSERLGLVDLRAHLASLGVDVTGWAFGSVMGLSADGATLTGRGVLNGAVRSWVVRLPTIEGTPGNAYGRPATPHTSGHAHTTRASTLRPRLPRR